MSGCPFAPIGAVSAYRCAFARILEQYRRDVAAYVKRLKGER